MDFHEVMPISEIHLRQSIRPCVLNTVEGMASADSGMNCETVVFKEKDYGKFVQSGKIERLVIDALVCSTIPKGHHNHLVFPKSFYCQGGTNGLGDRTGN
jgi:hypothetical protein